jgi:hypothetical protein
MTSDIASGTFGHRVNIRPDLPYPIECGVGGLGEIIKGVDGRYLGNFDSLYVAPFGLIYPVGFTNGTWYEQPGLARVPDSGCGCNDCDSTFPGIYYRQRTPGEQITCTDAGIFDTWDYAILPDRYTGTDGCQDIFDPALPCGGVAFPPPGACRVHYELQGWMHEPYPWPLATFTFANPSSAIRVVDDFTGPPGLEECKTLEIDFSGNGNEGVTFIGEDGGFDGASAPQTGIPNSDRSTTGWTVEDGSCWIEEFWIKAVEDNDAFICTGYDIITRSGMFPYPFAQVLAGGSALLTLDGDWQFWHRVWRADYVSPTPTIMQNVPFGIFTTDTNPFDTTGCPINRPLHARKGRVHIKRITITPCEAGDISIKRPSGRGT